MSYATPAELLSYLQIEQGDTTSLQLAVDLASGAVDAVAQSDTPANPLELKRVCLQVAARGYDNPVGARMKVASAESTQYGGNDPGAYDLTDEERRAVIRAVYGRPRVGSISLC